MLKAVKVLWVIAGVQALIMAVNITVAIKSPAWWSVASAVACGALAIYSLRLAIITPRLFPRPLAAPPANPGECGSCGHTRLRTETARQLDPCGCACHTALSL